MGIIGAFLGTIVIFFIALLIILKIKTNRHEKAEVR
jgi:VanZ family protein